MNTTKIIKLGLIQHSCSNDLEQNLQAIEQGCAQAAAQGANLILLQELHSGLYFCQEENPDCFDLAEPLDGTSAKRLSQLAKSHNLVIVGSLFEKRGEGIYHNTAVVFEADGTLAGIYRKMHIPDDPGYYEKFYFTPGDLGFIPIETSVGTLGVLVCWDQWFPESARLMAMAGAQILLIPTAIGWDRNDTPEEQQRQRDAWITVQRGHAIANGIPLAACNRCGFEPNPIDTNAGIEFWGSSFIAGPQGEILTMLDLQHAETKVTNIDLGRNEQVKRMWPFLRDRRIDAYEELLLRYRR